jgi:hypothetical protein
MLYTENFFKTPTQTNDLVHPFLLPRRRKFPPHNHIVISTAPILLFALRLNDHSYPSASLPRTALRKNWGDKLTNRAPERGCKAKKYDKTAFPVHIAHLQNTSATLLQRQDIYRADCRQINYNHDESIDTPMTRNNAPLQTR